MPIKSTYERHQHTNIRTCGKQQKVVSNAVMMPHTKLQTVSSTFLYLIPVLISPSLSLPPPPTHLFTSFLQSKHPFILPSIRSNFLPPSLAPSFPLSFQPVRPCAHEAWSGWWKPSADQAEARLLQRTLRLTSPT